MARRTEAIDAMPAYSLFEEGDTCRLPQDVLPRIMLLWSQLMKMEVYKIFLTTTSSRPMRTIVIISFIQDNHSPCLNHPVHPIQVGVSPAPTGRNLDLDDDALPQPGCKDHSTGMRLFFCESLVNNLLFLTHCFIQDSTFRETWEGGHKHGFSSSSCRTENHNTNTHSTDAFPPWNAFVSCSVALGDKKHEVLICPTTDFHFAVPMVRPFKKDPGLLRPPRYPRHSE
jgi:hypothetical protein